MPTPRVSVLAVIRHPATGALLVNEFYDPTEDVTFHRPCGGGVDWQEPAAHALVREFREEFGLAVEVGARLGVIENIFTFNGRQGHEVLFLYAARLAEHAAYEIERFDCRDVPGEYAIWRAPSVPDDLIPLYPLGLRDLLAEAF